MTITPIPDRACGDAIARAAELDVRRARGIAFMRSPAGRELQPIWRTIALAAPARPAA